MAGLPAAAGIGERPGAVAELFTRSRRNPVLTVDDLPYPANAVFNPAAAQVDGDTVLLCRVEDRRGISHLTVARSADGETGWRVRPRPLIGPDDHGTASRWGVEDPRLVPLDGGDGWLVSYTVYGPDGPAVALARTTDFARVERLGVVLPPDDKNAALLPRRVGGRYVMFHRPRTAGSDRADVWLSRSADLRTWTGPELVLAARPGPWWDNVRIGMGPPPVWTPDGWLAVYHGIKHMAGGLVYRAGAALLDLDEPGHVRHRGDEWLLAPTAPYERTGDAPNVVFPTGLLHDPDRDLLRLYYGAADTCVALATAPYPALRDYLLGCPRPGPDPDW